MPEDIIIGRSEADKKRFGSEALIYLGKHFVKMGQITSLSNKIMMDVARAHIVLVAGKRGSGKSYTLGVISEEISNLPRAVSQNMAVLIFDTMGIFWTMAYRNEKERELLKEWRLEARKLDVNIFVPFGYAEKWREKGIPVTKEFAIKVSEIEVDDWILTFGLDFIDPIAIVIARNVTKLREGLEEETIRDFDVDDIIKAIRLDKDAGKDERDAAVNLFGGAKTWGIFASKKQKGTKISELISAGKTSVLDLSAYSSVGTVNIRALVIGIISKKLFKQRMTARKHEEIEAVRHGLDYLYYKEKREMPMVWICIDEGHEFLPLTGKTAATDALIQLLREGRQPGISLVIATQQPGQIHKDVMTQSDIVVSHRVTAKPDIDSLNYIMQTYLLADIKTYLDNLPRLKGSAIILDDNSERIYPMRVRPRFTWHGGEAPTAVRVKKRI
ncbi:MAG: ATP-binding protein [Candidatus Pacearchaeota archaeon]|nr:MAG: ATP-binding protein [Candidatus Pacearchaeota archaeon]